MPVTRWADPDDSGIVSDRTHGASGRPKRDPNRKIVRKGGAACGSAMSNGGAAQREEVRHHNAAALSGSTPKLQRRRPDGSTSTSPAMQRAGSSGRGGEGNSSENGATDDGRSEPNSEGPLTAAILASLEFERVQLPPAPVEERPNFSGRWKCIAIEGDWEKYLETCGVPPTRCKIASGTGFGKDRALSIVSQQGVEEITVTNVSILENWYETFHRGLRQPSVTTRIDDSPAEFRPVQSLPAYIVKPNPPKRVDRGSSSSSSSSGGSSADRREGTRRGRDGGSSADRRDGGSGSSSSGNGGSSGINGHTKLNGHAKLEGDGLNGLNGHATGHGDDHAGSHADGHAGGHAGGHEKSSHHHGGSSWLRRSRHSSAEVVPAGPPGLTTTVGWEGRDIVCRYNVGQGEASKPIIMRRMLIEPPIHAATGAKMGLPTMVTRLIGPDFFASRTFALVDELGELLL